MLTRLCRLQGVQSGKGLHRSNLFVDDGVILHGTRAQRIETVVDTEIVVAEIGIVAHHRHLVTLRKLSLLLTAACGREFGCGVLIGILGQ